MKRVVGVVLLVACGTPTEPAPPRAASARDAGSDLPATVDARPGRFVRRPPPIDARRSVDACAYPGATSSACIDALVREPDPIRARYMRRLGDARVRVGTAFLDADVAECCNSSGACGAEKRTGHADCPKMDDGHACLVAAELLRSQKKDGTALHARACRCSWERAQIAVPGGSLVCDGPDRPTERHALAEERDVLACAACEPDAGSAACTNEIARLASSDPELSRWITHVHVVRCQVP